MIRRITLAVVAAAAVSAQSTVVRAQSSSQIRSLRTNGDGKEQGPSPYTMAYWIELLAGPGSGGYYTSPSHSARGVSASMPEVPDAPAYALFAPGLSRANTSRRSWQDELPGQYDFFNSPVQAAVQSSSSQGVAASAAAFQSVASQASQAGQENAENSGNAGESGNSGLTSMDAPGSVGAVIALSAPGRAAVVTPPAIIPTPEPATLALFATGLGALAMVGVRRQRRQRRQRAAIV